jgi:hypothetical protein
MFLDEGVVSEWRWKEEEEEWQQQQQQPVRMEESVCVCGVCEHNKLLPPHLLQS